MKLAKVHPVRYDLFTGTITLKEPIADADMADEVAACAGFVILEEDLIGWGEYTHLIANDHGAYLAAFV